MFHTNDSAGILPISNWILLCMLNICLKISYLTQNQRKTKKCYANTSQK